MTPKERLAQIRSELSPITAKALAEKRDFTPDEQTRVRILLDESLSIRESLEKAEKSRKLNSEVYDFLTGIASRERSIDSALNGRPAVKSRDGSDWSAALAEQHPNISHGGKALSLPPVTSFVVPAPGPVVAENIPFGHLLDIITVGELKGPGITYLRSVNRTRASTVVAAGELKPSKNLTLEKVEAPAQTIAVLLEDIKKQDLDDYEDLIRWIDFELKGDVLSTLDQQMLLGDGLDELEGLFFQDGVLAQEYSTSASASIRRAMAGVESSGYENTAIVLNPIDFAELELELNTAGDYRNHAAPANAGPRTVWGVPVASVPAAPIGLAIVGDLTQAHLWIREQVQVTITETNEDDFKRNLFVARAEMRAAFGVSLPGALSMVKLNGTVEFPANE